MVSAPEPVEVTVATTHETGVDANDGTATANPSGGTGDFTYSWSNAETTQMISGLAPGTYMVTVTDENGCTAVGSGTVNAFGCELDVELGPDLEICQGDTILLMPVVSGEMGDITFEWPDGSNLPTYAVSGAGQVCVTVTDDSGCEDTDCIIVAEIPFPVITCPVMHESAPDMNDGSIMCDSISGSITYLWSTGETTPGISGLAPGDYCVTMTDQNGCEMVQCFTVNEAGCALIITAIIDEILCNGDSTGTISPNVLNAIPPYAFIWSTGDTASVLNNLPAGQYDVTITDANGCDAQQSYTLSEPDPIEIVVDTVIHITSEPGAIRISVGGGVEPYAYVWSMEGTDISTEKDLEGITSPGFYNIAVTDSNGCVVNIDPIEVQIMDAIFNTPDITHLKVYPVPTQNFLTIEHEYAITEVIITGIDGRTQSRILNPVSNRLDVGHLQEGMYVLRMTDGNSWFVARIVK